jgi:hypothetical protein
LNSQGFTHYRPIRGDGNCYYRSVSYQYIEMLVINKNVQALSDLAYWIKSENKFFDLKGEF